MKRQEAHIHDVSEDDVAWVSQLGGFYHGDAWIRVFVQDPHVGIVCLLPLPALAAACES